MVNGFFHDAQEVYLCSDNQDIDDQWIATFADAALAQHYIETRPSAPEGIRWEVRPV